MLVTGVQTCALPISRNRPARRQAAPTPAAPVIDLDQEESPDEWYQPSPAPHRYSGRWGDDGQGCSNQAQPRFDDDGSDDDGSPEDYTVLYRNFGM